MFLIGEVFDAREHKSLYGKPCNTPWTFIISDGNYCYLPSTGEGSRCGYKTELEANEARVKFVKRNNTMFLVTRNADFTEGRGPMIPHKLFANPSDAYNYIMRQTGIYGSPQYCQLSLGINIYNDLFGYFNYNGYKIVEM